MSDREAFLSAIRANPDDDTARLAFADWLDEHNEPERAEFIRVQIELEPVRFRIDNPRALELHKREEELLRTHWEEWGGTDHLLTNPADFGPVFRRGFPNHACLSVETFLKNGEALFATNPTLREVALYGLANHCSELTMSPLLGKLDTLEIADWLAEDDAISLSVSPRLDRIKRFKLWLGGEPYFLRELVKQASATWPQEIELVQVCGGVGDWPESPDTYDETSDSITNNANKHLGRDAVRVMRPFERLFPLDGDHGYHLCAGHLPDGRPALAAGSYGNWVLVIFDNEGRVIDSKVRPSPISRPGDFTKTAVTGAALDAAFTDWVDEELELELGLIWVREFAVDSLSVALWSWPHSETVAEHAPNPPNPHSSGEALGWLHSTNFVINWFNDYWADWRGKIHSS